MTIVRLHNEDWGFESNCFVCEPDNTHGLRIPFFHDTERDLVVADFELTDAHSGAPTLVHGGVTLAILDEAMAWACIAVARQWAVTTSTSARFHRAIRVGTSYRVEAEVVEHADASIHTAARILDADARARVDASASFTAVGEAVAVRIAGAPVPPEHRGYLAGD